MPAKGSSKPGCCCDGCSTPPWARTFDFGGVRWLEQHLCCSCIPLQFCLGFLCEYTNEPLASILITLGQQCEDITSQNTWTGIGVVNGQVVRPSLSLIVDPYALTCSLCLTIEELGIVNECLLLDDTIRGLLCSRFCQTCHAGYDALILANFEDPDCGTVAVTLGGAPNTSLIPVPLAPGCPDPCDALDADPDPYGVPCAGPCDGCGCLCSGAVLTIAVNGTIVGQLRGGLCDGVYDFGDGWVVTVAHSDDSGCCAMYLTGTGSYRLESPLGGIPIGQLTANPCPNPSVTWSFGGPEYDAPIDFVTAHFECLGCDGLSLAANPPCCPNPIPKLLQCEVTITPNCVCPKPLGDTIFLELMANNTGTGAPFGTWSGIWQIDGCDHYSAVINRFMVAVGCSGNEWGCTVSFLAEENLPSYSSEVVCDPLDATFTLYGRAAALSCDRDISEGDVFFTITVHVMG